MILHIYVWAWILTAIGIGFLSVLILYTKYSSDISVRLYAITIVVAAICLGFAIHLFLSNAGI